VQEQLELLIELSRIDEELQGLLAERECLPGELAGLEEKKGEILKGVSDREEQIASATKDRKRLELDLEDESAKLRRLESKRLEIKTNEEYAALSLEIENARTRISEAEDAILRGLEASEQAADGLDEARREAEAATADLESRASELKAELGRLNDAIAIKRDERLRLSKRIEAPLLTRYNRILSSKGDTAIASVAGGVCSGCRIKLPPQMIIEVKREDRIIECQSCGRILHWTSEDGIG
jgi:uncharacterized protein